MPSSTSEFGVSLSDPGEGVSLAIEGFYRYGDGRQRFQPPRRFRGLERLRWHRGSCSAATSAPRSCSYSESFPLDGVAHARPRCQRRRRRDDVYYSRSASRSGGGSISRLQHHLRPLRCIPSSSRSSATGRQRCELRPRPWRRHPVQRAAGRFGRVAASATSRASVSASRTSAEVPGGHARPRTCAAGRFICWLPCVDLSRSARVPSGALTTPWHSAALGRRR